MIGIGLLWMLGCVLSTVSGGGVYDEELGCWDIADHPPVEDPNSGPEDITYSAYFVDGYGRCWHIQSWERPSGEGWGPAPVDIDVACSEEILSAPYCFELWGYEPVSE